MDHAIRWLTAKNHFQIRLPNHCQSRSATDYRNHWLSDWLTMERYGFRCNSADRYWIGSPNYYRSMVRFRNATDSLNRFRIGCRIRFPTRFPTRSAIRCCFRWKSS